FKMADETTGTSKTPLHKKDRFSSLTDKFRSKFNEEPEFYARAPGRVNLIGEHIDYCGYSVLPMAIEQDILIAAVPNDSAKLDLVNTSPEYVEYNCTTTNVEIDKSKPLWYHYFLCGYKGIIEHFNIKSPKGMNVAVDGIIPRSAGLSSSSALVCCAALVTLRCNKLTMSKVELADMCAKCEHYIGTIGGGMDQAISFLAQPGTAKFIEFNPLKVTDVSLPEGATFVISNSCVELNKAATSDFNIRVVECRLAAQVICKRKELNWREYRKLGDVHKALGVKLEDMNNIVKEVLHKEPYSKQEICDILNVTAEELNEVTLSSNTTHVQYFKLYNRATHVFAEANRVYQFKMVCDEKPNGALETLGSLMSASHESCRDLYECSHPDLDQLVNICMESGALGSRLTGAGWGGCAVSMVPTNQVEPFMAKVREAYYSKDSVRSAKVMTSLFASQPGGGAIFYQD
ncbi:unnamed protein product, partial [Owenia fusiformis]